MWHRIRDSWVLAHVDVVVNEGESVSVMGPSGSGKTTLLAILGGILEPTRGCAILREPDSKDVAKASPLLGEIGWVFQTSNALLHRSVLDNVAVGMIGRGTNRREAESAGRDALALVGLADRVRSPAWSLSGGELQRANLARALAQKPRFILADEPTAHLDSQSAITVVERLVDACAAGTGVVVATHDPIVAAACSTTLVLRFGRLVAMDT